MTDRQTDYVMVPREPTAEMLGAVYKMSMASWPAVHGPHEIYKAMIAAAPQPPLPSVEDVARKLWETEYDAETYPWAGEASEGRAMYYRFANSILSLFTAGRDEGEIK